MGLARIGSGLRLHDLFSADSGAEYDCLKGSLTVSGGSGFMATSDDFAVHNEASGIKCVTVRSKYVSDGSRSSSMWPAYWANGALAASADVDGYMIGVWNGGWELYRLSNGSYSSKGSSYSNVPSANDWCIGRVFVKSGGFGACCGTTTLANSLSSTDTTWTAFGHAGMGNATLNAGYSREADWIHACKSHLVTCAGLPIGYYFKVSDGTTTAKAQESSGTATVDAKQVLFPLASVAVYDGDPDSGGNLVEQLDTGTHADMCGGDEYVLTASNLMLMGVG